MPELPEVETVRLGLAPVLGVPIGRVRVERRDVVRDHAERRRGRLEPGDLLEGGTIASTRRRGKQLALVGSGGRLVLIHLGMSGQVLVLPGGAKVAGGHAHVVWTLKDGRRVVFRDPRRFGGVWLLPDQAALDARWDALGVDGLSVTGEDLQRSLGSSRRSVKPALLDQAGVAGVGNIYADESLFEARIDPRRPCDTLTPGEWAKLAGAIRSVLAAGIVAGGSTLRDYRRPDGTPGSGVGGHRVYGRGGQPCVRCARPLSKALLAQRTTVWCEHCQN